MTGRRTTTSEVDLLPRTIARLLVRLTGNPLAARTSAFYADQTRPLSIIMILSLASTVQIAVTPFLVEYAVNGVIARRDVPSLVPTLLAVLALAVLEAAAIAVRSTVLAHVGERVLQRLRERLQDKITRLPFGYFTRLRQGHAVALFGADITNIKTAVAIDAPAVVAGLMSSAVALVTALVLDWHLALLAGVLAPTVILLSRRSGGRLNELALAGLSANQDLMDQVISTSGVSGALHVRLFGQQQHERARYTATSEQLRSASVAMAGLSARLRFTTSAYIAAASVVAAGVGAWWIADATTTVGTVAGFVTAIAAAYQPWTVMTEARERLAAANQSLDRIYTFLDEPESSPAVARSAVGAPTTPDARSADQHGITMRDVWFTYEDRSGDPAEPPTPGPESRRRWALRGVDLTIPPGERIALVGTSGSGKSTIGYLISGLFTPTRGRLLVDGPPEAGTAAPRPLVGCVTQDPYIFHGTIAENVRYGRLDACDEEIWQVLTKSRLDRFVQALPLGLDTVVGARGYQLSGGERQRLAIARTLLQDAAVIVFDEATSQLDAATEAEVAQAVFDTRSDRITVLIAHRLSTVRDADRILVLDEGSIVESGSHEELFDQGGLYTTLYQAQIVGRPATIVSPAHGR